MEDATVLSLLDNLSASESAAVVSLLDNLSNKESLGKKFLKTIRQPPEFQQNVEPENTEYGNAHNNEIAHHLTIK